MKKKLMVLLVLAILSAGCINTNQDQGLGYKEARVVTNHEYFETANELISSANSSIKLLMFQARKYDDYPDSESNQLLEQIIQKNQQGTDTKIVLEGGEDFLGEKWKTKQFSAYNYLNSNNVPVKEDPEGTLTHAKLLIVDEYVLIGSTNWNYNALTKNHETNLLVKSRKIRDEYTNYFNQIWKKSSKHQ